ncbi:MAG: chemotaxis protein CheW [Proteobacteria bacterium]|nr:chemotaxis protein CheW [Pseudomonadota bacterium]MBU1689002.1 chemotaxis protein CheW [Pseudomonadota bacterium]
MLLLLFETKDGRYALDSKYIVEIIPLLNTKRIPAAPAFVKGMLNYHGMPVPVFDFCALEGEGASRPFYSTRIILLNYPIDGGVKMVGIIAERATDVIKCSESDIRSSGILLEKGWGAVRGEYDQEEIVQLFDVKQVIPEDVVRELF